MRKVLLVLMAGFILSSCGKDTQDVIGTQDDTIKLSARELNYDTSASTKEVTTEGSQWNMLLITNEDNDLDYSVDDLQIAIGEIAQYKNTPIKIEGDWFTITGELQKITVDVKQNTSNKKRTLKIGVNDRNYFDRITVTQSGK